MFDNTNNNNTAAFSSAPPSSSSHENGGATHKRKRRPAGTPDPDAEVVSLSPKTLLESDRYVCEICNQGFQRDQNLQMHRRRHKVPWKLLKRELAEDQVIKKRVFVCPEPSCLHHDPSHALGDLVGIKKHFRRKHSNHKQWVCDKCSKGYAVQSDYKAHLKTCGTRGHSCDCGRVFSRVESFIEHQDTCTVRHVVLPELQAALQPAACSSRTASSTSPSSDTNFSISNNVAAPVVLAGLPVRPNPTDHHDQRDGMNAYISCNRQQQQQQQVHKNILELQLLPSSNAHTSSPPNLDKGYATNLKLSIGSPSSDQLDNEKNESSKYNSSHIIRRRSSPGDENESALGGVGPASDVARLKEFASEELKLAVAEKSYAEDARREAKRQIEMAEIEFANAKRIRQQAQAEVEKAQLLKEQATKRISSAILQITCQACKQHFHIASAASAAAGVLGGVGPSDETSLAMSYMSSATTEGEGDHDHTT
ncbi:protein SHOOT GRAVITROPISM 5-like [Pyrus ussuriensis x Pyrus communis]|uniref:Protein SHOOT GRAVITROPISM 5-like n=1 Tax=Pyrus ussuriensis x Pyrus communis TaxID=2448454 RepID=A0A5N5GWW7_9ROSA|nr:protein SHOOT GRAVITROPISM 5-like [Pyrus ussuriensis x Pyrus communis]